jgi:hypothetical protein
MPEHAGPGGAVPLGPDSAGSASDVAALGPEDAKLVTLARAARARIGAREGAAVRDGDGRTYAAATVRLPSLDLSALQLAVANAVAAGATVLEAAAVVTPDGEVDAGGYAAVRDVGAEALVHTVSPDGTLLGTVRGVSGR